MRLTGRRRRLQLTSMLSLSHRRLTRYGLRLSGIHWRLMISPPTCLGMMAGWGDTEVNRLVTGVKMGFVQGKTTRQIVKEVVGAGGLADISQRNAATVIRTALNHVSTQARETTYKKNSDIVEKYEWVSTLDSRTSTICRSRDGQKYEIGKGPLPPAHPNCRSTTAPVISSDFDFLDAGAKRAARGAEGGTQVDASTTYYEFLKHNRHGSRMRR